MNGISAHVQLESAPGAHTSIPDTGLPPEDTGYQRGGLAAGAAALESPVSRCGRRGGAWGSRPNCVKLRSSREGKNS